MGAFQGPEDFGDIKPLQLARESGLTNEEALEATGGSKQCPHPRYLPPELLGAQCGDILF